MNYQDYLDYLKSENLEEEIIITRHEKCITLGKNSTKEEILENNDLPIFFSNRGGGATYHDFGQLTLYPRINLKKRNLEIKEYINLLENWGINAVKELGIDAVRKKQPGLWINNYKVAFIGLAIRNQKTEHGISFNLAECEIENFKKIIACRSFEKIGKIDSSFDVFLDLIIKYNPFSEINLKLK